MTADTQSKTLPVEGKVTRKSQKDGVPTGLQLDVAPDHWYNYTRQEWRDDWFEPSEGDFVRLQVGGGKWVKSIELLESEKAPWDPAPTSRETSIIRQTCIKAAAEVVAGLASRGYYIEDENSGPLTMQVSIDVQAIAQELERWVIRE